MNYSTLNEEPTPRWKKGDKLYWKLFSSTQGDKILPVEVVQVSTIGYGTAKTSDDFGYTLSILPNMYGESGDYYVKWRDCDYLFRTEEEAIAATFSPF